MNKVSQCSLEATLFLCHDDIAQNNFLWRYHQHCDNSTSAPFSFAKISWSCSLIQPEHQVWISVFISFILTNNHQIDIYLCFILFFLQIKSGLAKWYVKVSLCVYVFSGSWNKSPTRGQFRPFPTVSWRHGGVYPSTSGPVELHPLLQTFFQLFVQVFSTKTLCLAENAVVFVFRHILKKLLCDICCGRLVTDALTATFDQSSHLLKLKNRGGLMIPSEGTARVVRSAEHLIRCSLPRRCPISIICTV